MNGTTKTGRIGIVLVVIGAVLLLSGMRAEAHRDRGPNDVCRREIGTSLLHITLYQTQFDPVAEYCEEVPGRAGAHGVDVTPGQLREVPLGLEIIATTESGQSQAVVSLPPRIYERGVVNTEVVFAKDKEYVARVMVELEEGQTPQLLAFPIQVAAWYKAMMVPGLIIGGVLAGVVISAIRYAVVSRQDGQTLT